MADKERKEVDLKGRLGLFENTPAKNSVDNTQNPENPLGFQDPKESKEESKKEIKKFDKNRPLIRVGFEIYKDLDKKIEFLVIKEEKNKRQVVNELLESALKNKSI